MFNRIIFNHLIKIKLIIEMFKNYSIIGTYEYTFHVHLYYWE